MPDREPDYPVNYVLDGQQRLSSIYAVFCAHREFEAAENKYAADPKVFEIAFTFEDETFIPRAEVKTGQPSIGLLLSHWY